jgi:molybdopterin molybdotransferase
MATRDAYPILSVEEARGRILEHVRPLEAESVPILETLGRVLCEDIVADAAIPPHDNSAMDGYAVRHADLASSDAPRLAVIGQVPAGAVWEGTLQPGQALRIMTGAPMPAGADTVVRFEDTVALGGAEGDWVVIRRVPRAGSNVRLAGEDVRPGSVVLAAGQPLGPAEIGMLASVGRAQARVHRRPRVAVLATGDEILPLEAPPEPGKIRNINSYTNAAQVLALGGEPLVLEVAPDRADSLVERLRRAVELQADLIVTSGGVSVGDFDLVKEVLASEGAIDFWWVNMKPGKPMAFGLLKGIPLLALPGNPVAAMLSFLLFGRPAVRKMLGHRTWGLPTVQARLAEAIARKDGRRHYLRVRLAQESTALVARLTGDQGSGILTSLVVADGLAVIPETCDHLAAGSLVDVMLLRPEEYWAT